MFNEYWLYYFSVNVFIGYSLIYIIFWDTKYTKIVTVIHTIVMKLGLWHSWCMFSNPSRVVDKIYAKLTHKDGTERAMIIYDAASLKFMGQSAKNIRLVKIAENIVHDDTIFVKYFTKYLYRKYNKSGVNKVSLFLNRTLLPGIRSGVSGEKTTMLYQYSE